MDLRPLYFIMYARFDSVCKETGKGIKEGDVIAYLKPIKGICGGRVFCKDSKIYHEAVNSVHTSFDVKEEDV